MTISISSQAYIFLYSILSGMGIAFIYDLFRIKRKRVKTASVVLHIEDFLYWIIICVVMFATVYYSNEGEIRGFIFLGTALGVVFYIVVFSRLIMSVCLKAVDVMAKVLRVIWSIITYPFKIASKILYIPYRFIVKAIKKGLMGIKRMRKRGASKATEWRRALRRMIKKV